MGKPVHQAFVEGRPILFVPARRDEQMFVAVCLDTLTEAASGAFEHGVLGDFVSSDPVDPFERALSYLACRCDAEHVL
jgi:hypothetical protein